MRGTLAKALRRIANRNVPLHLPSAPTYGITPGTTRIYTRPVLKLDEHGVAQIEQEEAYRTFSIHLTPDCRRYFTQKFKRTFTKGIH